MSVDLVQFEQIENEKLRMIAVDKDNVFSIANVFHHSDRRKVCERIGLQHIFFLLEVFLKIYESKFESSWLLDRLLINNNRAFLVDIFIDAVSRLNFVGKNRMSPIRCLLKVNIFDFTFISFVFLQVKISGFLEGIDINLEEDLFLSNCIVV